MSNLIRASLAMGMGESKAVQVLNTYLKFCNALHREGKITDENFNRIRFINGCINGKQDKIREIWGDIFDEIYCLLQKPEIKLRLEEEQRELEISRQKRKLEKQKSVSNLKKIETSKKSRVPQHSASNKNSKEKKQKKANKLQSKRKNQGYTILPKSIEQIREIFWRSVALAKEEEEARKKLRRQNVQPIREVSPVHTFDESSIFEDIMDERRAEGKGYGGSK
jgi:hypothetical protein